jgi:hypothetical protein
MRTLITVLLVLALAAGATVLYLASTTPRTGEAARIPLRASHRELLELVPASAESFALLPTAAVLHGKLLANPVTREPALQWMAEHELPRPWMLGRSHVAVWKSGKTTSYAVRFDRVRALLVRLWLLTASTADTQWSGSTLIMHESARGPGFVPATRVLEELESVTNGLPEGDALLVQQSESRGAFPPIGRPSVTSVSVTPAEITIVSRAAGDPSEPTAVRSVTAQFPRGAMLTAAFATPPAILGDLNRLLGAKIDALVDDGGSISVYGMDMGTLLPRPRAVIVLPADAAAREQLEDVARVAALVGETRDTGQHLLVSFDRSSLGQYLEDEMVPAAWPATRWALRIDPERFLPVLRRAGDSAGLRFATPRLYRAARDLRQWIGPLEKAGSIEAAQSGTPRFEELRVRVTSK